jgi:hypothetical protein
MKLVRLKPLSALFVTSFAVPLMLTGCGEDGLPNPGDDLCCTEFNVGADLSGVNWGVDASLEGRFSVFAQASADLSAVAAGALADVTVACQNIALDLGADPEDASVKDKNGKAAATAWCALAVGRINAKFGTSGSLGGSLSIDYQPPVCTASFSAKASCQGKCDVNASCDLQAMPPTCEGGELSVQCEGSCTAKAGATLQCKGSCDAECKGSCSASGGVAVECQGKCDGTCEAGGGAGNDGIQADGSCRGVCNGTCTADVDAPAVECTGVCNGECTGSCEAAGEIKAECNGECSGNISAPKCSGGELKGGCMASADCEASCEGSAQAKAECIPPSVAVSATASASLDAAGQLEFQAALASIKANLPNILVVFKARGDAFVSNLEAVVTAGAGITASADKLGVKGAACGLAIAAVIGEAAANMKASVTASASVVAAVGG